MSPPLPRLKVSVNELFQYVILVFKDVRFEYEFAVRDDERDRCERRRM